MNVMLSQPWVRFSVRGGSRDIQQSLGLKRLFATATPESSFVDARHAPSDFDPDSAVVYNGFITESEGESLVKDIVARMKRYVM
jgi:hypothetical protein